MFYIKCGKPKADSFAKNAQALHLAVGIIYCFDALKIQIPPRGKRDQTTATTGNPGSVIVPQYGSSKITVFVWGKNTILKFVGNTKYKSMKLTLQLVVVVLIAPTKFRDNLQ